ncbi:hypothetical protein, partial [Flavobacterium fryxellicola]
MSSDEKATITDAIKKQYSYGPYIPKVTSYEDFVVIDVDTETILKQDADYKVTVALCEKGKFDDAKVFQHKLINKNPTKIISFILLFCFYKTIFIEFYKYSFMEYAATY